MNFIKKHPKLWLILSIVGAFFLVVFSVGYPIAMNYQTVINQVLKVKTFEVVKNGSSSEDSLYFKSDFDSQSKLLEHEESVCAEVMGEGAALLLNKDVNGTPALPLGKGANVSLFSQSSVRPVYGGTGSGQVNVSSAPSFKKAFTDEGLNVNTALWNFYETGDGSSFKRSVPLTTESKSSDFAINEVPWKNYGNVVKNSFASYGDAAIVVLSRAGGEGCDLSISDGKDAKNGDYLHLNVVEEELFSQLQSLKNAGTFKKLVVLLNTSNMVQLDFLDTYGVDACLWIGDIGTTGSIGVARLLSGTTVPSGRTAETYLKDNHSFPAFANFGAYSWTNLADYKDRLAETPNLGRNSVYVAYQEGIYIGYRYYETRYTDFVKGEGNPGDFAYDSCVAFPFGSGLSYTSFAYSDFALKEEGEELVCSLNVTNTGKYAGKHTVQIYLQSPYTAYDKTNLVEKAAVELVGFQKTPLLAQGEKKAVEVRIKKSALKAYDPNLAKTYILDQGDYLFSAGRDAHDAANNFLAYQDVHSSKMSAAGEKSLVKAYHVASFDDKTYATSAYTGKAITNRFDGADVLKYSGMDASSKAAFRYLTRQDWSGSYPTKEAALAITEAMLNDGLYIGDRNNDIYRALVQKYIAEYQADEGTGQKLPTTGATNGLAVPMLREEDANTVSGMEVWNKLLDQMSRDEIYQLISQGFHATTSIGSISLPATKNENGPQGLTASLLGGSSALCFTSADILAATYNPELAKEVGHCMGEDCLYAGYSGMYAPGANTHRCPYEGRSFEYYSEDGFLGGSIAQSECAGIASKGVLVQMKHFVLNDQETSREGISTWASEQAIREVYLKPFELALANQGPLVSVMNAFNRLGTRWCGAHRGLMTGILSTEWNVEGSNITDCSTNLDYMDGTLGVLAGTTLWDGSGAKSVSSMQSYLSDPVVATAMRHAAFRVAYSISRGNGMNGLSSSDTIRVLTPWYKTLLITLIGVNSVVTLGGVALFVVALLAKKRQETA